MIFEISCVEVVLNPFLRIKISFFPFLAQKPKVGVLIVHGGDGSSAGRGLHICIKNIHSHTKGSDYKIYLWNNNPGDASVAEALKSHPGIRLVPAATGEKLKHLHAVPLQKLYEIARKDNVQYIVTMDTDAFPVKANWLPYLIRQLDGQTVLAGIWRDELKAAIPPYIHPSCLCTTVNFIERYLFRFDDIDISPEKKVDTLSCFTRTALMNNKRLFKLRRSNKEQFHYIMGGLYGDLVYHHGAGSRKHISFWGEEKSEALYLKNKIINQFLQHMVVNHEQRYIDWLMGKSAKKPVLETSSADFYFEIEKLKKILAETDMNHA